MISATPEPVPVRNPIDGTLDRIHRVLVILLAVSFGGLVLCSLALAYPAVASRAGEGALEAVGSGVATAGVLILLALVQLPMSCFVLAVLRGQRRLLSDRVRLAATVSGLAIMAFGWIVAGSGVRGGILVGAAVFALGVAALPAALVSPRVRSPDIGSRLLVLLLPVVLWLVGNFVHTMDKSYLAAMKSDLRNYVTWQDQQRAAAGRYAPAPDSSFPLSNSVILVEARADSTRFMARVGHQGVSATCAIFVGESPAPPAVSEGVPACTAPARRILFDAGLCYLVAAALVTALAGWRLAKS